MQKIITFVLMLVISTSAAMANPNKLLKQDLEKKYQQELSRCAVFYEILAGCLSDEDQRKNEITALSKKTTQQAMQLGIKINMKVDKILARLRQDRASLISEIKGKCSNYSVIIEEHYENCTNITNVADNVVKDWEKKDRGSSSK